ncbi:hypothetical protein IWW50_006693 [Coemansia erecta]|nr:hypothetical protein GGF43_006772 [Coemansia sp. RSA 2618]KAJ2815849.1 hypothetical protein IWW50_006693 [Coemansia erecta]
MPIHSHMKPPALRTRRRPSRSHSRRASPLLLDTLPTPPEDAFPAGPPLACTPDEDQRMSSPHAHAHMTMAEKVREANRALVHHWGRFLAGAAISELCSSTVRRRISVIDLPASFCIAPVDELLCPCDDPTRVIVVVSPAGLIVDTGIFDLDGPVFYHGSVVANHYVPSPLSP